MRKVLLPFLFFPLLFLSGCSAPETFIRTMEPTWATIEIRDGVQYESAWKTVLDLLIRRFDIEVSDKESGYIRTGWLYTWTGQYTEVYRVRVTIKFNKDQNSVDVKSEAYFREFVGYDTRLLQTIKTDIMGTIGRITR